MERSQRPGPIECGSKVKGLAFLTVLRLAGKQIGEDKIAKATATFPLELRSALADRHLLATGWYPIEWYKGMWKSLVDAAGGDPKLAKQIGRDAVMVDLPHVYPRVLRLLSPATLARIGSIYFGRFYDPGKMRVVRSESRIMSVRFEGCVGFDRNMWVEVVGSIQAFVELSGVEGASVHQTGGGRDGDEWTEVIARWA